MLENMQEFEEKCIEEQENNEEKNKKIFGIEKVKDKKESCQGSSYNVSSEEQKNNQSNGSKSFKNQINWSNTDSNMSTRSTTNYILLDKGKVIIKGNEIETVVPWDIETINNKISMISPRYPVKVSINPLSLSQPHVYNPKNQSFASKESYQSMGQISNFDAPLSNSITPNSSQFFNQSASYYQQNSQISSILQILEQTYWIENWELMNWMQRQGNNSNFEARDQRRMRNNAQNNQEISQFLSKSLSSFTNMLN